MESEGGLIGGDESVVWDERHAAAAGTVVGNGGPPKGADGS